MEVSYLKIENLYRRADILQCFALEKIHGTSANISITGTPGSEPTIKFFAGGESHDKFSALFDVAALSARYTSGSLPGKKVVIYGEAFGGKQQGMGDVYGKTLRFMAFDVQLDEVWLDVPSAVNLVEGFGLEFVPYERGPLTLDWLNEQRDRPSVVAVVADAKREGIVVRPIYEAVYNDGSRMIFKHKGDDFRETKTPRQVDPEKLAILTEAGAIADEWVVPMRLEHVLQKTPFNSPADTGLVLRAMIEDVKREAAGEIVWSKDVEKAIGRATVKLLQRI